ncbi:MAG: cytochrome c oxidase subunit II [Phycisphaerae bacterium]|nr:cytochrome c oxidase subunit II [Phycisphaerae bacterium]|tara:strand:- start:4185 stop:5072 length:888 start_codon:yes stop_codon:yes gene_type:complete
MLVQFFVFCDAATPWQLGFQDPATPIAEGIVRFHHDLIFILVFVCIFVFWMLIRIVLHFNVVKNSVPSHVVHGTTIEIIWTIIPAVLLIIIAVPSFALLYSVDEVVDPSVTLKIIGHQWYWSYEYSDYETKAGESVAFDSYILPEDELSIGDLRLLEVDNRIVLPVDTHVRLIVTSADVLHSWTIPSFGVKIDACPGRLNEASLFIQRPGVFYGQCSEICGVNHGFMPISVEALKLEDYVSWVASKLEEELFYLMFLSFSQLCFILFLAFIFFGRSKVSFKFYFNQIVKALKKIK